MIPRSYLIVHLKMYRELQRIDGTRKYEALLMPSVVRVMFLESRNLIMSNGVHKDLSTLIVHLRMLILVKIAAAALIF